MEKKTVEKNILNSVKNSPQTVTIDILKPTIWERITRKEKRLFTVYPLVLAQNIEITKILLDIPEIDTKGKDDVKLWFETITYVSEHTDKMVKIVSILLGAKPKFILKNVTNQELFELVQMVFAFADFQSFMSTIVLTRAKTSLKN